LYYYFINSKRSDLPELPAKINTQSDLGLSDSMNSIISSAVLFNEAQSRIKIDCQLAMVRSKGEKRALTPTKNKKMRSFKVAPSVVALLKKIKNRRLKKGL